MTDKWQSLGLNPGLPNSQSLTCFYYVVSIVSISNYQPVRLENPAPDRLTRRNLKDSHYHSRNRCRLPET